MIPFFVQIKCQLGKSYQVANKLADAEIASEIYSTAGDFDLLVKFYVDPAIDIGTLAVAIKNEKDKRAERRRFAQAIEPDLRNKIRHAAHTICLMSSTGRGFSSGLASHLCVMVPSRITSMVWLSPIVSSRVSEVRTIATPCLVTARASS